MKTVKAFRKRSSVWKTGAAALLCVALAACSAPANNGGAPAAEGAAADGASGGRTVVTMSVMTKDRFLEEAEQKFESAHPDIDIQIVETSPADPEAGGDRMMVTRQAGQNDGPDPEQVDKYVTAINTAIMSGKASDIIAIEHLPSGKYAEKGLLADWNELADRDADFTKADYYENIFDGVSSDGHWYGIPTSFSLQTMVGDASLLEQHGLDDTTWTWDQFVELLNASGKNGGGKYGLAMIKPEDLLVNLTESVYERLVRSDGSSAVFDAAAFQGYMEQVKGLYDSEVATADQAGPESASFGFHNMRVPIEIAVTSKVKSGSRMLRPPGTGSDEGIPFKSGQVLGLNAQSKVKEAAWEFVKFLLSQEMQASNALINFPVHREALSSKLKETQEMLAGGDSGGKKTNIAVRGPDGAARSIELTDEDIEQILAIVPSVGKYENRDAKVLAMIREESAAYFSGSRTAQAVADLLANRIATYLNE